MTCARPSAAMPTTLAGAPNASEQPSADMADSLGFTSFMADGFVASIVATTAEGEGESPRSATKSARRGRTTEDESAELLILAGLVQTWANIVPCPPAPLQIGPSEPTLSAKSFTSSLNITEPACSVVTQMEPSSGALPSSVAGALTPRPDSSSFTPAARLAAEPAGMAEAAAMPAVLADTNSVTWDTGAVLNGRFTSAPASSLAPILPATLESPPVSQFQPHLGGEQVEPAEAQVSTLPSGLGQESLSDEVATTAIDPRSLVIGPTVSRPGAKAGTASTRPLYSAAEMKFAGAAESHEISVTAVRAVRPVGTGTAEREHGMNHSTELKQFAGLERQDIPQPVVAFRAAASEPQQPSGARSPLAVGITELRPNAAVELASLMPPNGWGFHSAEEVVAPRGAGTSLPVPMDPLQSSMLKHVTELRHTGANEMAVVLKPDAETQLSLRLSLSRNGEVNVQARYERGDAQMLAANWGDIRHSLAQQGVRLGALEFSSDRSPDPFPRNPGSGGPSPDGQSSSQRRGQPWPETLDDLPLVGAITEPLLRRGVQRTPAGRSRRWESWA